MVYLPPLEPLDWRRVMASGRRSWLGRDITYYPTVPSTNPLARDLLRSGAPSGVVVVADEQTQGRGRHGRRWTAPPRSGLAVSVGLRLPLSFPLPALPMASGLAADAAVRAIVGSRCGLKWPNDVLIDEQKVGGILLDLEEVADHWLVVIGIGLNVSASPPLPRVTCLVAAAGAPVDRASVAITLLDSLEQYVDLAAQRQDAVWGEWRQRLVTLGRSVRVQAPDGTVEGRAVDVDGDGALLIAVPGDSIRTVHAGDVTLAPVLPDAMR